MSAKQILKTTKFLSYFLLFSLLFFNAKSYINAASENNINIEDLGYSSNIKLSGNAPAFTFSSPIQTGQKPTELTFDIDSMSSFESAVLLVKSNNKTIKTYSLPLNNDEISFSVPLSNVDIKDKRLDLTFQAFIELEKESCNSRSTKWIELTNININFEGDSSPPETISDYWPRYVEELKIYIPSDTKLSEEQARTVLNITQFMSWSNNGPAPKVTVIETPNAIPTIIDSSPYVKTFIIRPAKETNITLYKIDQKINSWPALLIEGNGEELRKTVDTLFTENQALLYTKGSSAESDRNKELTKKTHWTLGEMGFNNIQFEGNGKLESSINFSQANLGGVISDLTFNLNGIYSNIPEGGTAQLAFLFNNEIVEGFPLNESGEFTQTIKISNSKIQRDNKLTVQLNYTPPGGKCLFGLNDMIINIDGESSIDFNREQTLLPGFDNYPQVLLPKFSMTFNELNLENLNAGTQLLSLIQDISNVPLSFNIIPLEDAYKDNTPLIVVSNNSDDINFLNPIFSPYNSYKIEQENINEITAYSYLHAFNTNEKDILLLTHNNYEGALNVLPQNLLEMDDWYTLTDDVWFQSENQAPYSVRLAERLSFSDKLETSIDDTSPRILYLTALLTVIGVTSLLIGALYQGKVKSKSKQDIIVTETDKKDQ